MTFDLCDSMIVGMELAKSNSEIFIPDGAPLEAALGRASHMGIGAHQDDIEIMAYHGIAECFGRTDRGFLGVIVTDGAGSPRDGVYAAYTDDQMREVRRAEQKKAAVVGEYCAQVFLDFPSAEVKVADFNSVIADLETVISAAWPEVVYTHSLLDKHDTHVAVAMRVIQALRRLPKDLRPKNVYGCEVWRGLDWLVGEDRVALDVSAHPNLAEALVGVFDSQICGGKRYDTATIGRRQANATYMASHSVDTAAAVSFAMDLTPLIEDDSLDIGEYAQGYIIRLADDTAARLKRVI